VRDSDRGRSERDERDGGRLSVQNQVPERRKRGGSDAHQCVRCEHVTHREPGQIHRAAVDHDIHKRPQDRGEVIRKVAERSKDQRDLRWVDGEIVLRRGSRDERDLVLMGDLHEVDVVRGPGSATYGPGAVMLRS